MGMRRVSTVEGTTAVAMQVPLAHDRKPADYARAPALQPAPGNVRPLEERDVERVANLYERVLHSRIPAPMLRARLLRILIHHPWRNASLPSLVYENRGQVVGCLGVLPRPMTFNGQPIVAAVGHSFIVEPGSRSTLAALELERHFFAGVQDLSLAEGNDASRIIWEKSGGFKSLMYGLHWTKLLKPSQYALAFLNRRGMSGATAASVLRPLCWFVDRLMSSIPQGSFRFPMPALSGAALDANGLSDTIAEATRQRQLRPHYDEQTLSWLLATLAEKTDLGTLECVAVRNAHRETVGWYLYFCRPGGVGTVVQLGAKAHYAEQVMQHLFHHAAHRGVIAVHGQVDPALFHAYSINGCLFHHDGRSWMLFHSRHPPLRHAIDQGQGFITRLEGEWWIGAYLSRAL